MRSKHNIIDLAATKSTGFKNATGIAVTLLCMLTASKAYASCLDDSCCLVKYVLAGLLIFALILLAVFFVFPLLEILMFPIAEDLVVDIAEEAAIEEETEELTYLQRNALMRGLQERGLWGPLQDFLGSNADSAWENALNLPDEPPAGISQETLETYQRIAQAAIDRGVDTVGTQTARLQLIDVALKLWFY